MNKIKKMKNLKEKVTLLALLMMMPLITHAQWFMGSGPGGGGVFGTTNRIVSGIGNLVEKLIPIVIAIALLVFFWGLVKFIRSVSDTGKAEGKTFMVWGLIALFVMVAVWGILKLFADEIGISTSADKPFVVPKVPRP